MKTFNNYHRKADYSLHVYDSTGITTNDVFDVIKKFDNDIDIQAKKTLKEYKQKLNQFDTHVMNKWLVNLKKGNPFLHAKFQILLKDETKNATPEKS